MNLVSWLWRDVHGRMCMGHVHGPVSVWHAHMMPPQQMSPKPTLSCHPLFLAHTHISPSLSLSFTLFVKRSNLHYTLDLEITAFCSFFSTRSHHPAHAEAHAISYFLCTGEPVRGRLMLHCCSTG